METVEERRHLPALKQVLKLYSSIPISKLALIVEMEEKDVRQQLELLRSTSLVKTWVQGSALDGELQYCGDIEFSIDGDVVVGHETKAQVVKGDFLVAHIRKLGQIAQDLNALPPTKA